jgi:hypothetical protein
MYSILIKDWVKVMNEYNLDNSNWNNTLNTCRMPTEIIFEVLTSKVKTVLQQYVVSARLRVIYR